jgi:hypothetical protein
MSTNKQNTLSVIWLREGFYFLFLQEQIKDIIIIMPARKSSVSCVPSSVFVRESVPVELLRLDRSVSITACGMRRRSVCKEENT